jgi:hypothetical protein
MYRSQIPTVADDDDVHLEGEAMAEIGHQTGSHSMRSYVFSLRTVRSTGTASQFINHDTSAYRLSIDLRASHNPGRRVLLWRQNDSRHKLWQGHCDMLLSEVWFALQSRLLLI